MAEAAGETGFRRLLGVEIVDVREDFAHLALAVTDDMMNQFGTVAHGGVVGALLDSAMGNAINGAAVLGPLRRVSVTLDLKVHYLAAIGRERIDAIARVAHNNGETALIEGEVHTAEGRLAAVGTATFLITKPNDSDRVRLAARAAAET